jgi:phosphatidylserine/phosphatidylglycerophosphate/cardiolipin synthase-like enzyme
VLVRAVRRGVRVRALVNSAAIVNILRSVNIQAKCPDIEGLVHSKMIIIDGKDLIIGSHNFTQHAFTTNLEVSTYIPNYPDVDKLLSLFNNLYI